MYLLAYAAHLNRCQLESTESEDQFCLPLPPDIETCRFLESLPLIREEQVGAYLSAMSPTEQEEDSLLTLSSVTARPLLAASRRLHTTAESTEQFWVAGLFKSYGVLYVEIMETFPDSSESVASWIPAALSTLCLALGKSSVNTVISVASWIPAALSTLCLALGKSSVNTVISVASWIPAALSTLCLALGKSSGNTVISVASWIPAALSTLCLALGKSSGNTVISVASWIPAALSTLCLALGKSSLNTVISVASWIPAALSTLCLALGKYYIVASHTRLWCQTPLSSALCEKYSCRLVVFIGGLFCATGLSLSYFSQGLLHLLLSFGVMTGIGGGLSTTPGIVIVSQYFDKHRSLYIRPPLPARIIPHKLETVVKPEKEEQKEVVIQKKTSCVDKISRYLDVSLLKSWRFGLLCASVALMSCGSPYALYYLPAYTVQAGHSKTAAGRLVAISAVLDLILVAGLAVLSLPSLTSWWALAVASGAYGLCLGCWFLLVPVLLADTFGTARIASSYGL
ncbi:Monocarboxylate transporter 12, partial [Operophtera brumata]